jgi:site-specific recombinase XerD
MAQSSPLRRRMIEGMSVRNMSPATQRSYVNSVSKFSRHFGKSPDRLGLEEVRAFHVHLVSTGISWPGLNQTVCALRFFYGVTLGRAAVPERIPHAREPQKLPVVLSADEVARFLQSVSDLKPYGTAYAAGLRALEVAGLRVRDASFALRSCGFMARLRFGGDATLTARTWFGFVSVWTCALAAAKAKAKSLDAVDALRRQSLHGLRGLQVLGFAPS